MGTIRWTFSQHIDIKQRLSCTKVVSVKRDAVQIAMRLQHSNGSWNECSELLFAISLASTVNVLLESLKQVLRLLLRANLKC